MRNTMEKIWIFGHKKPDTDSVVSAIALSYLKNKMGFHTEPRVLGDINNETKFVLDHFHVPQPKYLNDVKLQIRDLHYKKDFFVSDKSSIFATFHYMNEKRVSTLPIVNKTQKFIGAVSMKDVAKDLINGQLDIIRTSYDNILTTLNGDEILKFDQEIQGNILMVAYRSSTFIETVNIDSNTILIVGDRHSIIEHAVKHKVKMIILTADSMMKEEHLKIAEENGVNVIRTSLFSFRVAKLIGLCNYVSTIVNKNIVTFLDTEEVNDFIEMANKTKYSNYPVVTKDKKCLGILKLSDAADRDRKKVILVDHNNKEQSVEGLSEAEILEVVDHHNIGNIGTSLPINFRTMPVGCTCTIIYQLFKENNIAIPAPIAGLMASAILSDTLAFTSPTTTIIDQDVVAELSKLAEIDIKTYSQEMFKAGSSLKGKTKEEVLYTDFKNFEMDNRKIGVCQILSMNVEEILQDAEEYIDLIEKIAKQNEYYMVVFLATDIQKNGSYIYFNQSIKHILENSFEIDHLEEGAYLDGVVSRKKQVIPNIMSSLEKGL